MLRSKLNSVGGNSSASYEVKNMATRQLSFSGFLKKQPVADHDQNPVEGAMDSDDACEDRELIPDAEALSTNKCHLLCKR